MQPGDVVGDRFDIDELAGAGGMGQVFRARDKSSGELVAVKVLLGDAGPQAARFEHETRALAELSHPGIVRYVAHGIAASGQPYLAMEWLDGEDLLSRFARARLTINESVALGSRIAEALGAAHARGIVHRDLKPSNVFLVDRRIDRVKLLDFGIARLDGATRVTQTGVIIGTPGYMAPEQIRNDRAIDPSADVFSLGCLMFECLTGKPAFAGDHLMAVLAKVLFVDPPQLRDVRPEAPDALDRLLSWMLAKDPKERPLHGAEVAEALAALGSQPGANGGAAHPSVALTRSERRTISVVLLKRKFDVKIGAAVIRGDDTLDAHEVAADPLRRGAEAYGGQLEHLRDGSIAVSIGGNGLATDQAAQAARCALWLRKHADGRTVALATGRGEPTGRMATAEAIDRAVKLLLGRAQDTAGAEKDGSAPVAIDEMTAKLLDGRFDVREGEVGLTLHGEREIAEGTKTLLGKATPCVGRDLELRTLEQLFDECVEEPAACASLVTAPPGTGKSRLAQELLRTIRARGRPASVWIGRGEPLRAGSALGLLSQILHGACGIRDGEPLEVRRGQLVAHVAARIEARERQHIAEFLGEIVGVPFPDEGDLPLRAAREDAQLMNERMLTAFIQLLRAECEANPVLLVLEDLHWGDRPTVRFLDHALRDLRETPLFVLALARPEVHELFPKLWAGRHVQEIQLKQLGKKASERLARHVLGDGVERDVIDRLVRLSAGNAFYLEELIRATAEGRGGDLPETVVAMVQSRLGALDEGLRRTLRAASVFGEIFWAGSVARLLGAAERATVVRDRIEELLDRELIVKRKEGRFSEEDEYAFSHALLREGAYAMLTDEDRALGHRLAGEWLERQGEQDPLALAEHFEQGGEEARAGVHYLRAAEQAGRGGDTAASIASTKRGLACRIPDELRVRCLGMLCEAHHLNLELLSDGLPYAEEVVRVAEQGSAPWSQGMLVKLTSSFFGGNLDEFMALLGVLRESRPAPGAANSWSWCIVMTIYMLDLIGHVCAANSLLVELVAVVRAVGDRELISSAHLCAVLSARTAYAEEDPAKALEYAERFPEICAVIGHGWHIRSSVVVIGMNRWYLGISKGTERMLTEATLRDEESSVGSSLRPFTLAWLLVDRGAFDEARLCAGRLIESGRSRRLPLDEGRGHWALAEVLRRAGELEAADAEIQIALAILGKISPLDLPGALATLAALRLAQGKVPEALLAAEEGLAKYESMGACGFFRGAFLRLTHAECLDAAGSRDAARKAIAIARERLRGIAEKIGDPAHRRSFLDDVPENRRTLALAREWLGEGD